MMKIEQLLSKFDKSAERQSDGSYIIALDDSNDFARTYTIIDNMEDSYVTVQMNDDMTTCNFIIDGYELVLSGDLKADEYTLTIEELK